MWMIGRIIYRLMKSFLRVLLVGWTPGPSVDYAGRLEIVEKKAEATRQKVYRDDKAAEATAGAPPVSQATTDASGYPIFRKPDGTPYKTGDPV